VERGFGLSGVGGQGGGKKKRGCQVGEIESHHQSKGKKEAKDGGLARKRVKKNPAMPVVTKNRKLVGGEKWGVGHHCQFRFVVAGFVWGSSVENKKRKKSACWNSKGIKIAIQPARKRLCLEGFKFY